MAMEVSSDLETFERMTLKANIFSMGASLVGFGDVSESLAAEFAHLPCAISLAVRHEESGQSQRSLVYSHQNQKGEQLLADIQNYIIKLLRSQGRKALAIPADSARMSSRFIARLYPLFPHKTAATCSGLGWVGKNGLLITPQYGCQLTWATVLTNAPLKVSTTPYLSSRCGKCHRCIDACPVGALSGGDWSREKAARPLLNIEACRSQLEKNAREKGIFACGRCILACSRGSRAELYQKYAGKRR